MHVHDLAPDFSLTDQHGHPRTLSTLLEAGPVVLFFYPAALSRGCTEETCHFRDLKGAFAAYGAQPVGISMDAMAKQEKFSNKNDVAFPLLSDVDGAVAHAYGVKRALSFLKVKRATFVIGADRRILEVINSEVLMHTHADRALAALAATSA